MGAQPVVLAKENPDPERRGPAARHRGQAATDLPGSQPATDQRRHPQDQAAGKRRPRNDHQPRRRSGVSCPSMLAGRWRYHFPGRFRADLAAAISDGRPSSPPTPGRHPRGSNSYLPPGCRRGSALPATVMSLIATEAQALSITMTRPGSTRLGLDGGEREPSLARAAQRLAVVPLAREA